MLYIDIKILNINIYYIIRYYNVLIINACPLNFIGSKTKLELINR